MDSDTMQKLGGFISRRGVLQLANAALGLFTLSILFRIRNTFRMTSPSSVLSSLGLPFVPKRASAYAMYSDSASRREAALQFIKERDTRGEIPCPRFPAGADWINSRPLSLTKELKGKVVLLDFFTYCCINCQHVLPKLAELERKYGQDGSGGVVVVGVHSAKFSAERETANIAAAVERYEVQHPVVNDERMEMWNTIGVTSWPSFVLVGPRGNLLALWSGEQQEKDIDEVIGAALEYYADVIDHRPLPAAPPRSAALQSASASPLRYPGKLVASDDGKSLFVADSGNNRIVEVNPESGAFVREFGDGKPGLVDSPDPAKASFHSPQGLCLASGALFVADTENHAVRVIDLNTGQVSTVGGNGEQGYDYGAGRVGTAQKLSSPWDVELDADGVLYVAMAGTHQIWSLDVGGPDRGQSSKWQVFSGSGRELEKNSSNARTAAWAQPSHLSIANFDDARSVMYVADSESSTIRTIDMSSSSSSHPTKTLAGGDGLLAENLFAFGDRDGIGARAKLQHPLAVVDAMDGRSAFVADSYNHRIKIVDQSGKATAFVGSGKPGFANGRAGAAQFWEPAGLALSADKTQLFVSDTNNGAIRVVDIAKRTVSTLAIAMVPPAQADTTPTRLIPSRRRAVILPTDIPSSSPRVAVTLQLPEASHFTEGAASRWQANVVRGDQIVQRLAGGASTLDLERGTARFATDLPKDAWDGEASVEIESVVYYCMDVDNVCRTEADVFVLSVSEAATNSDVTHAVGSIKPRRTTAGIIA